MNYIKIYLIALIMSIIYTVFVSYIGVLDGGLIGIALIVNYVSQWSLGVVYFVLNLPILLWVWKIDKVLFKNSVFGMISFSVNTFLVEQMELTIAMNFYAVLLISGFVLGICFYLLSALNASFGGISPIGVKLNEWGKLKLSNFYLITDFLVLTLGLFFFGWKSFLFSMLFVCVLSAGVEMAAQIQKRMFRKVPIENLGTL